jgi:putative heme iron utilization protein
LSILGAIERGAGMSEGERKEVYTPVTPEVAAEVRALIADAEHGVLGSAEAGSLWPMASRVSIATLLDGTPIIFISALAAHYAALVGEPRCSLLVGPVPGKGDPMAYPRVSLFCRAAMIAPGAPEAATAQERYLAKNPKAELYIGLADFSFFRLDIERASFNGGFARGFRLQRADLVG